MIYLFAFVFALCLVVFYFTLIALPKRFFYICIFFSISTPSYLAYKLGDFPAISLDRIFLIGLFVTFIFSFILNKDFYLEKIISQTSIILPIVVYFIWLLICSSFSSKNVSTSLFSAVNWFVTGPFIFLGVLFYVNNENDLNEVLKVVLFASILCNLLGVGEFFLQKPLFADLLITDNEMTRGAVSIKIRNDNYRIASVFYNPLVYSQFLICFLVNSFYLFKKQTGYISILSFSNVLLSLFLMLQTGSRAGLILIICFVILYYLFGVFNRLSTQIRFVLGLMVIVLLVAFGYIVVSYIITNIDEAKNLDYLFVGGYIDDESTSNLARIRQLYESYDALSNSPFMGYGSGNAMSALSSSNSIDNYYLTILLESGFFGLFVYLYFMCKFFRFAFKSCIKINDFYLNINVIILILMFVYYFILSISTANILIFLFVGLFVKRCVILSSWEGENKLLM